MLLYLKGASSYHMETLMGSDYLNDAVPMPPSYSVTVECHENDETNVSMHRRESESYVAVKGQSLILTKKEGQKRGLCRRPSAVALNGPSQDEFGDFSSDISEIENHNTLNGRSFDGAAVAAVAVIQNPQKLSEIERHLHQMTQLLRQDDSIKLVVKLESSIEYYTRYLAVVSCMEPAAEEYCLLGINCRESITLGLILPILSHTTVRLDGDGGFCVSIENGNRSHIFKPVSVQTMWSALSSLYQATECAKSNNSFQFSAIKHYENLFNEKRSDQDCLNEWNALPGIQTKRPNRSNMSSDEINFYGKISTSLREVLSAEKDLDEVTSKEIRTKLEQRLQMDLSNYRSFIDEEMLKIVGQMEAPAKICQHLFLGTEWNASHQEELTQKEIGYILNVTAEIDNFFPDKFSYMNISVRDNEQTDLLRYFDQTYRFITEASKAGKNVLVHCKMGISRSATIVIAYVMKNSEWSLKKSLDHVKRERTCVKPNPAFMKQLEIYEGLLKAKRKGSTLEKRSKSESNLKRDNSLSVPKREITNISSSTENFSNQGEAPAIKSPRKYYNTAPARLKPDLSYSTLRKPKSSSLVSISGTDNHRFNSKPNGRKHIGAKDKIGYVFEKCTVTSSSHSSSKRPIFEIGDDQGQMEDRVCVDNLLGLIDAPRLKASEDIVSKNDSSEETQVDLSISQVEQLMDFESDPAHKHASCPRGDLMMEKESDGQEYNCESRSLQSKTMIPALDASIKLWEDEPQEAANEVSLQTPTEKTTKKVNLKCSRHPFNEHTFSVSPNQIVNISSRFSVKHLVNEFELHSNRSSLSSLGGTSVDNFQAPTMNSSTEAVVTRKAYGIERSGLDFNSCLNKASDEDDAKENETELVPAGDDDVQQKFSESGVQPANEPEKLIDEKNFCESTQPERKHEKFRWSLIIKSSSKADKEPNGCNGKAVETCSNKSSSFSQLWSGCLSHKKVGAVNFSKSSKEKSGKEKSKKKINDSFQAGKQCGKQLDGEDSDVNMLREPVNSHIHAHAYQSTGVVKQRREVFEAKMAPTEQFPSSQCMNQLPKSKSHCRSKSVATTTPCSPFSNKLQVDSASSPEAGQKHQRKSSVPCIINDSQSPFYDFKVSLGASSSDLITNRSHEFGRSELKLPSAFSPKRKASFDSNASLMIRSSPTVRGFESSASISSSKCPGSNLGTNRLKAFTFSSDTKGMVIEGGKNLKQQHGSTHPLTHLSTVPPEINLNSTS